MEKSNTQEYNKTKEHSSGSNDLISRQDAIEALREAENHAFNSFYKGLVKAHKIIANLPSAEPKIIRCKDCKYWKQQMDYQGKPLSFGFCESEDMWRSLYGETTEVEDIDTDDNHYCGFAEKRTDE